MSLPASSQVTIQFQLPGKNAAQMPQFTLKSIQIEGLSDAARDELLQKLPVHIGTTVDGEVMHSVRAAVQAFDEHLMVAAGRNDGSLHIFVTPPLPPPPPPGQTARIRVGGNVQQAKLVVQVRPVYPPDAKAARIQGVVELQAIIGKDGAVENLTVLSGHPLLVPAAMDAIRNWRYQTTLLNGDPVEVMTQVDVNFTLAQ
jgi:TonB family protein